MRRFDSGRGYMERRLEDRRVLDDRRVEVLIPHRVGVTGPVQIVHGQDHHINDAIAELRQASVTEFTSGCAFGVDTIAARTAVVELEHVLHRFVVPARPHNSDLVPTMLSSYSHLRMFDVVTMPEGTSYLDRNEVVVSCLDVLLAFPETSREVLRSGTWHTVRAARKQHKIIRFYPLNGDERWNEVPDQCSLDFHLPRLT